MYSPFQLAAKYLRYYLTASNGKGHGMHSPFIFHFITKVLNDKTDYPEYTQVEALREKLKGDHTILKIEDMGAGSAGGHPAERTVASVASRAAKPKKFGQLLYRMVQAYQPSTILELGTSLGITSCYLALARPAARLVTMEGAKAVAAKARENFSSLQLPGITLVEGNFDHTLLKTLQELAVENPTPLDLVFVDGNHRREPTERYFNSLLPYLHNDTILVFDDIHWSREMEQAWHTIQSHPAVRCTVDLFFIGLVFFRQEFREKQHFSIRF
jgi:predicted O-methyltransferase YrrM